MGKIVTRKNDNNTLDLEITYGGEEAPFSGLDTSAPPPYVDPLSFTDCSGFVVINNQLVCLGWRNTGLSLTGWGSSKFLGCGKFFANQKYYNWVLGYTQGTPTGTPPSVTTTYLLYVFGGFPPSGSVGPVKTLDVPQTQITSSATSAVAQIAVSPTYTWNAPGGLDWVTITIGSWSITLVYHSTVSLGGTGGPPSTPNQLATLIVNNINGLTPGAPCTATLEADGVTIDLTTIATGTPANSTTLSIAVTYPNGTGGGNYSGSGIQGVSINSNFHSGTDPVSENFGIPIDPLSWTTIGESLYFGGPGTCILTFSYPNEVPQFNILTKYLGAVTLNKFNNQLIAGGIVPGPGQVLQSPEMMIAWSQPGNFSQWNPQNGSNLVTGAGFEQIADISDYISGTLIGNNILVILKAFGVDYANALQNAVIPFDVNHISNALIGEGCQDSRLVTQYDQVGCFVGTTDVFQYTGQLNAIGTKIKNSIIYDVIQTPIHRSSVSCTAMFINAINTFAFFLIDHKIYIFCYNNQTWSQIRLAPSSSQPYLDPIFMGYFTPIQNYPGKYYQFNCDVLPITVSGDTPPQFYYLTDTVQTFDFPESNDPYITFKQEEIMFGRDITIDSIYTSVAGAPGQVVGFNVYGSLSGSSINSSPVLTGWLTIPAGADPNTFYNYQIFFTQQVTTVKSPYLNITLNLNPSGTYNQLRIAKIAMFGSFDPDQRPT